MKRRFFFTFLAVSAMLPLSALGVTLDLTDTATGLPGISIPTNTIAPISVDATVNGVTGADGPGFMAITGIGFKLITDLPGVAPGITGSASILADPMWGATGGAWATTTVAGFWTWAAGDHPAQPAPDGLADNALNTSNDWDLGCNDAAFVGMTIPGSYVYGSFTIGLDLTGVAPGAYLIDTTSASLPGVATAETTDLSFLTGNMAPSMPFVITVTPEPATALLLLAAVPFMRRRRA